MTTSDDIRPDLVEALREHLRNMSPADALGRTAESVVEFLEGWLQTDPDSFGWLVMQGVIRRIDIADDFGPSSWEITCPMLPGDLDRWRNRYRSERKDHE